MAKSWKERKEEEARILAEMDEAMQAQNAETQQTEEGGENAPAPQEEKKRTHCPKCGNYMKDDGVCPACGHRIYVPMDEGKQKTARLIIGAVCIVAFLLIYFVFGK